MSALPEITVRAAASALMAPLSVPTKLLTGPGPSNQHPAVTAALASPLLGHMHPEFLKIMDEVKDGIRYFFQTNSDWCFAISGTGHCAMEAACMNLLEPGDSVLVCRNGIWGERFAELARRLSLKPVVLDKPPGQVFAAAELEAALAAHRPRVAFAVHGESSTGALQPLEGLGAACHRHGCLLLVDSVAAAGGVPLLMDAWGIDCVYTGSQKCLGCTPGLGLIAFSEAAKQRILARSVPPPSWYLDARQLANYWGCRTDEPADAPAVVRRYHHTAPVSLVCAMREALRLAAAEGLPAMWRRHAAAAVRLRAGLRGLGLSTLVPDGATAGGDEGDGAECWAPTITAVLVPEGVDWRQVSQLAMARHSVEIAGGLGPTAGKVWRIGLMGANATEDTVDRVLAAFGDAYKSVAVATQPRI